MKKQVITYDSPVDALIALSKRLNNYKTQYRMPSLEIFFDKFNIATSISGLFVWMPKTKVLETEPSDSPNI